MRNDNSIQIDKKYSYFYRLQKNVLLTDKGALVEITDKAALVG